MSVYQHVLPGMQAEAAATFAGLLNDEGTDDETEGDLDDESGEDPEDFTDDDEAA